MKAYFKSTVLIPLDLYKKMVLLVADGKFESIKDLVTVAVSKLLEGYSEQYFNELSEKYKDLTDKIDHAKGVVVRKRVRKW
jgi:hypothetical protein